jgi:AraC family transcriptional regulator, alkane utilization regulator
VDPLSDVLRMLKLTGVIMYRAEMAAPWSVAIPDARDMDMGARAGLPGLAPRFCFHIVVSGECDVVVAGERRRVGAGSVVLLPTGHAHDMASGPGIPAVPAQSIIPPEPTGDDVLPRLVCPGTGPATVLLCGFLACDGPLFDPLLAALPPLLIEEPGEGAESAWFAAMLQYTMYQGAGGPRPGFRGLQTRLVELMVIEVLRRYIAELPTDDLGWLAALRDPHVGRAVAELHADPGRAWTVADLARKVGVSRSVLAERFCRVAGMPPMQYLAQWRLQVACSLLKRRELSIAEAAARVGYQSESAFHRAFKRVVGEPPATWRTRMAS